MDLYLSPWLVTTTGIKGKVFSPRRPNSYWMQSFRVIMLMLMLISGHSNLLSLLKILKSRQSQKMTRTLVGLFWRLIQPAGSASLIIHLQTNLTTFFLSNTISSVTSSSSLSPRFTTSAGSSLSTCMKESLKIAEKYYCSEQRKYIIARKALGWASLSKVSQKSLKSLL